jgi:hypothetical protein
VLFGERPGRASRLGTAPGPLAPNQLDRSAEARHIDQTHGPAAVAVRDHPTRGAAAFLPRLGLDLDPQPRPASADPLVDVNHVEPVESDEQITPRAVARIRTRASTRRRLGHRRGLPVWMLGRSRSSGGLGPSQSAQQRVSLSPRPPPQVRRAGYLAGLCVSPEGESKTWEDRHHRPAPGIAGDRRLDDRASTPASHAQQRPEPRSADRLSGSPRQSLDPQPPPASSQAIPGGPSSASSTGEACCRDGVVPRREARALAHTDAAVMLSATEAAGCQC